MVSGHTLSMPQTPNPKNKGLRVQGGREEWIPVMIRNSTKALGNKAFDIVGFRV